MATVDGKDRKYYTITDAGRETLEESRHRIGELAREASGISNQAGG